MYRITAAGERAAIEAQAAVVERRVTSPRPPSSDRLRSGDMSEGGSARDLSDRALAVMVRLLPSHRSEWGRAMRAELASLDDVRARRRYTLGCMRAVLSDRTAMRTVALHVVALTFGAVALAFATSINGVGVRIQTIVFVLALGVLAWSGRRSGPLGPIADHPPARRIRAAGYVVLGAYILPALASFAAASPQHDQSGVWMFYVALSSVPRDCPVGYGTAHGGPTADAAPDSSGHGRWAGGMVGSDAACGPASARTRAGHC